MGKRCLNSRQRVESALGGAFQYYEVDDDDLDGEEGWWMLDGWWSGVFAGRSRHSHSLAKQKGRRGRRAVFVVARAQP